MEGKSKALSSLIVNGQQRLIFVIDEIGRERRGTRILHQWLSEQGVNESNICTLPLDKQLQDTAYLSQFLADCRANGKKLNNNLHVLLPTLADLLCYMQPTMLFELLHELRNCAGVQCTLIWASTQYLIFPKLKFLISGCEYISDTVVHLRDENNLCITARKRGGGVTCKSYKYKINKNEFIIVTPSNDKKNDETNASVLGSNVSQSCNVSNEHGRTFKIELEEEELVARNAMKLPYEKTSETVGGGGNIVYTPDAADDFDEEDPDEDLCI